MYDTIDYSFTKRLAILLGCDIAISVLDSFIPHELTPIRAAVALVEFGFMTVTMGVTMKAVLEDY